MKTDLLGALEASDLTRAQERFAKAIREGANAWEIHRSLFPVAQRVQNPPFINPHLPKMYGIYRQLAPYLTEEELPSLVELEVTEYARRPKREELPPAKRTASPVAFQEIESAIRERDTEKATLLMAAFSAQAGDTELARRLLLLGSGYLPHSLGHSISCTAFILREMLERRDQDPWPALATLAHYFCEGGFHTTSIWRTTPALPSDPTLDRHVLRAASGRGIVNLHHTITLYALEQIRSLLTAEEYAHTIGAWIAFMEGKEPEPVAVELTEAQPSGDYRRFYETFCRYDARLVVSAVGEMVASRQRRAELGRFLIKSLCDHYQGDYNPHCLTGLGSALWVADRYGKQPPIVFNAFYQYLDFLFDSLRPGA